LSAQLSGAWTNMSIENTARTGADKGFYMVVPENCCSTMNAEWHIAAVAVGRHRDGQGVGPVRGLRPTSSMNK
jgi:nicotinamidase-related amidase